MDKDNVKFYIPKGLTIPTDLIVYVGETYVKYNRIHGGFCFHILEDDEEKAMEVAKEIAEVMIYDHDEYEHGITLETVKFEIAEQDGRHKIGTDINWYYRVRDIY